MREFENLGLKSGVWSGLIRASAEPERLVLIHHGEPVAEARTKRMEDGVWRVEVDLPADRLNDGTTTFILIGAGAGDELNPTGDQIAKISVAAGEAVDQDLLAEIELIRAELDLLKREFRRINVSEGHR